MPDGLVSEPSMTENSEKSLPMGTVFRSASWSCFLRSQVGFHQMLHFADFVAASIEGGIERVAPVRDRRIDEVINEEQRDHDAGDLDQGALARFELLIARAAVARSPDVVASPTRS